MLGIAGMPSSLPIMSFSNMSTDKRTLPSNPTLVGVYIYQISMLWITGMPSSLPIMSFSNMSTDKRTLPSNPTLVGVYIPFTVTLFLSDISP